MAAPPARWSRPRPGWTTASVPSSAATRWRRPMSPVPVGVGAARALVARPRRPAGRRGRRARPSRARAAGVLGGVGQRLGHDEVGGRLDHRQRPAQDRRVHGDRDLRARARAPRPPPRGRGRPAPAARCRGRGRAARRWPRPPPRGRRRTSSATSGLALQALLGAPELHAQGDEARLGAVVQVALDAPQLGRLDVEGARAGARELVDARRELALLRAQARQRGDDDRVGAEARGPAWPPPTAARTSRRRRARRPRRARPRSSPRPRRGARAPAGAPRPPAARGAPRAGSPAAPRAPNSTHFGQK